MRNPEQLFLKAPIFIVLLCLSSCRTVPQTTEVLKPPAKTSPAQERYKKMVEGHLGQLWYRLVASNEGALDLATVKTTFEMPAAGGKVRSLRVISNTGGRMDELIARGAIEQLRAPPIPPDVLAQLGQNYMVFEESFSIYPENDRSSPTSAKKR
jgi:hypothetical protein